MFDAILFLTFCYIEHLDHLRADALGNPSYMAPECLDDKPITNFATDVWSVGVLTFMVLVSSEPMYFLKNRLLLKNEVTKLPHPPPRFSLMIYTITI